MPEVTAQYIRIPVSEGHEGHRIRTIEISAEKGIKALYCGECKKIITYLFDKDKWTMSEAQAWIEKHKAKSVHIKSQTQEHYTIAGYTILWGGRDLEGEWFDKDDTDLWLGKFAEKLPLFYMHGADEEGPGKAMIGHVTKMLPDDIGLWIEGQVDMAGQYARAIIGLVRKGLLGLSSGTISHLARIAADGKILSWPLVEVSLTPIPAEPRTLPVREIKCLTRLVPSLKSVIGSRPPVVEFGIEQGERVIRLHH